MPSNSSYGLPGPLFRFNIGNSLTCEWLLFMGKSILGISPKNLSQANWGIINLLAIRLNIIRPCPVMSTPNTRWFGYAAAHLRISLRNWYNGKLIC